MVSICFVDGGSTDWHRLSSRNTVFPPALFHANFCCFLIIINDDDEFLFCWDNKQAIRNIPVFDACGIVVPTIYILYRDSGLQRILLRLENTTYKKFLLWIPIKFHCLLYT